MNWRTLLGTLILISSWSVQSCKDDEPIKWVDLRYKAADSYTIAASGEETVSIQVKSTDPWIVYSNHSDWCTISPNQGEANELYDVQITYTQIPHWTIVQIPSLSKVITGLAKR